MSRFCGKCGAKLPDDGVFCPSCGSKVDNAQETDFSDSSSGNINSGVPGRRIPFAMIAAAAAALLVIIIAVSVIVNSTGSKGTIGKYFKCMIKEDGEKAVKLMSNVLLEKYDDDEDDLADFLEAEFEYYLDVIDDELGRDPKISFKIKKEKEYSDRKFEDLMEYLEEYYDIDTRDVKAVKTVSVDMTIKAEGRKDETEGEFIMIKEKGKWRIFSFTMDTDF